MLPVVPESLPGSTTPGAQPSDTVSVIIVSYNTCALLRRCLQALAAVYSPLRVWVVDNASTDGSADMVRTEFPEARLMASGKNLGFAAANNWALRQILSLSPSAPGAGGPVLFLNPDTEVLPGSLAGMADYLRRCPDVGAVGVQLLNPDGTQQRSYGHFWFNHIWSSLLHQLLHGQHPGLAGATETPLQVDWLIGACILVSRPALDAVGELDEAFFIYSEEIDWQFRLHQAGYRVALLPTLHVVHYGAQSTRQAGPAMLRQEYRSRYLLVAKHRGRVVCLLYLAMVGMDLCAESLRRLARAARRRDPQELALARRAASLIAAHLEPGFRRRQ